MTEAPATGASRPTVHPARPARRRGVVTAAALVAAVLLAGSGAALVQQGLVDGGIAPGQGWLDVALRWIDDTTAVTAASAAAGLGLLGLLVLLIGVGSGRRHEVALPGAPGVVLEEVDVARISSSVAEAVDGVMTARSVAGARRVVVRVATTGDPAVPAAVERDVAGRLTSLGLDLRVGVRDAASRSARRAETSVAVPGGPDA